ncbi:MAG: hypothetical protein ACK4KW_13490 [Gemmobacter sp.]
MAGIVLAVGLAGGQLAPCLLDGGLPSDVPVRGDFCELHYQVDAHTRIGLGQVQLVWERVALQSAYQSDGCRGEAHAVVLDCKTGRGVAIGTRRIAPDSQPVLFIDALRDAIGAALARGEDDALAVATAAGRRIGMTDVVPVQAGGRITLNGQFLGLGCACRGTKWDKRPAD